MAKAVPKCVRRKVAPVKWWRRLRCDDRLTTTSSWHRAMSYVAVEHWVADHLEEEKAVGKAVNP